MKKRFSILILSGMVAVGTAFSATKQNILTVRESFPDSTTVYPESFETDTEKLLQNWYVQNYTILDEEVESKSSNEVSEDVSEETSEEESEESNEPQSSSSSSLDEDESNWSNDW